MSNIQTRIKVKINADDQKNKKKLKLECNEGVTLMDEKTHLGNSSHLTFMAF